MERPALLVDRNSLDAADLAGPGRSDGYIVPSESQRRDDAFVNATLKQHRPPIGQSPSRRLDRGLDRQSVVDVVDDSLQLICGNAVPAG